MPIKMAKIFSNDQLVSLDKFVRCPINNLVKTQLNPT